MRRRTPAALRWETVLVPADRRGRALVPLALAALPDEAEPARPGDAVHLHRPDGARADVRRHRGRDRHLGRVDPRGLGRHDRPDLRSGREHLVRGDGRTARGHRARAPERLPRRGRRAAVARGHARHARGLPRRRVPDPQRRGRRDLPEPLHEASATAGASRCWSRCSSSSARRSLGFLLHATRFGRYIYAIGSNREASRLLGRPGHARAWPSSGSRASWPGSRGSSTSATSARPGGRRRRLAARRRHGGRARRAWTSSAAPARSSASCSR